MGNKLWYQFVCGQFKCEKSKLKTIKFLFTNGIEIPNLLQL